MRKKSIASAFLGIALGTTGSLLADYLRSDLLMVTGALLLCASGAFLLSEVCRHYPRLFGILWRYATCVVVLRGESVLLVRHKFYEKWMPPGHRVGFQKFPHEAALHAVARETGLRVSYCDSIHCPEKTIEREIKQVPQPFFVMREGEGHRGGIRTHYDLFYVCHVLDEEISGKSDEDCKWFDLSELEGLIEKGELYQSVLFIIRRARKLCHHHL